MHKSTRHLLAAAGVATAVTALAAPASAKPLIQDYINGAKSLPKVKNAYTGPKIEMRYAPPGPAGSHAAAVTIALFRMLERETSGKITVRPLSGDTGGAPGEKTDMTSDEKPDYSVCPGARGRSMAGFGVFDLPGVLPPDPHIGTRILNEVQARFFRAASKGQDLRMAPAAQVGTGYFLMSRTPIRTVAALKGARIAVPDRSTLSAVKSWGAIPLSIKVAGLFFSAARGTIGAAYITDRAMIESRLYKMLKYRTEFELHQSVIVHCVARAWFAKLPRQLKGTFRAWSQLHAQAIAQSDLVEPGDRAVYAKSGVTRIKPSVRVLKQLQRTSFNAVDDWKAAAKSRGYDPKKILASIAALRSRYAGKSADEITELTISKPLKRFPR